jgi:uncharacterized protein YjbJ (UPF0337 family)
MNNDYVRLAAHDVIGKLQEQAGKPVRNKDRRIAGRSRRSSGNVPGGVGDARKVFASFFKAWAAAAQSSRR